MKRFLHKDGKIISAVAAMVVLIAVLITPVFALPPPWYVKPPYSDYAPSGMPDFDERQRD